MTPTQIFELLQLHACPTILASFAFAPGASTARSKQRRRTVRSVRRPSRSRGRLASELRAMSFAASSMVNMLPPVRTRLSSFAARTASRELGASSSVCGADMEDKASRSVTASQRRCTASAPAVETEDTEGTSLSQSFLSTCARLRATPPCSRSPSATGSGWRPTPEARDLFPPGSPRGNEMAARCCDAMRDAVASTSRFVDPRNVMHSSVALAKQGLARLSDDAVGAVPRILRASDRSDRLLAADRGPVAVSSDKAHRTAVSASSSLEQYPRPSPRSHTADGSSQSSSWSAVSRWSCGAEKRSRRKKRPRSDSAGATCATSEGRPRRPSETERDESASSTPSPAAPSAVDVMLGIVFGSAPLPRSLCSASALVCVQGKTRARIAAAARHTCATIGSPLSISSVQETLRPMFTLGKGNYACVYASAVTVGDEAAAVAADPQPVFPAPPSADILTSTLSVPVAVKQIVDGVDKFCSSGAGVRRRNLRCFDLALAVREARMLNVGAAIVALGACPAFPTPFCSLLVGAASGTQLSRVALACERNDMEEVVGLLPDPGRRAAAVADESGVSAVVIVMQRASQTMREWVSSRTEEQVAPLLAQAMVGVAAAALFGASHNDLYDRNVLIADVADVVLSFTMPSGARIRLRTRCDERSSPQLALLSDWGIVTARHFGPLPEARARARSGGGGAPALEELTHTVEYDFDVKDTMTATQRRELAAALEAASDCGEATQAAEHTERASRIRRTAAFAAAAKRRAKAVHVMLARGMPVWARDLVALVSSVREVVNCRQGAKLSRSSVRADGAEATQAPAQGALPTTTPTPWMDAVLNALESAVAGGKLDAAHKVASFVEFVCSSEFCAHAGCPRIRKLFEATGGEGTTPVLHYDLRLIERHMDLLSAVAARDPFTVASAGCFPDL